MKWLRKILKGVSLTAAMFVFQACYGTMEDYYESNVTFHIVDVDTGEPMSGVRVWVTNVTSEYRAIEGTRYLAEYTDENGMATVWTSAGVEQFTFVDKDSLYTPVDTLINPDYVDTVDIVLKKMK